MKQKNMPLALMLSPLLFLAACKNPADKTQSAEVTDAVEKVAESVEGGQKYVFTSNSVINFVGSKVTGSHDGGFKDVTGYFTLKDGELAGNDHKVVIQIESIWSDTDDLTDHLKSEDFFYVEKFPESTFEATSLTKKSDTEYELSGNFTLRGETKNLTFPVTVSEVGGVHHLSAKFDINRKDFGIVYTGKTDDLIRDEVILELKLEAKPEA